MNDFILMEPSNQSFAELMSNGVRYIIPRFQRNYSWEDIHLEDLWNDIQTLNEEGFHYMGYIVLQRKDTHRFEVIDGQQRLITLSLLVLCAMHKLQKLIDAPNTHPTEKENNQARLEDIRRQFIGSRDIVTLTVSNKLELNRNNNAYFKNICRELEAPSKNKSIASNKLLQSAFTYFTKQNLGKTGEDIARFVTQFSERLIFTKIVVHDDVNAYKVFETLNARGVQLSTPDLLKNHIFFALTQHNSVPDEALDDLDEQWEDIVTQLSDNNFTDFIRYHYLSSYGFSTKKDLFKKIRNQHAADGQASIYLQALKKAAPLYAALSQPHSDWWGEKDGIYNDAIHELAALSLFNIRQPFSILMAAYEKFTAPEFVETLRYLRILSIRYNIICKLSPNEQEKTYSQIAVKITQGTYKRASNIKNGDEFKRLYPKDDATRNSFIQLKAESSQAKKTRFLLAEIENHLGNTVDYTQTTLEHICPQNPSEEWRKILTDQDNINRLGNMTLLKKDKLGRDDFAAKKEVYQQSSFKIAQHIAQYTEWTEQTIYSQQEWLAEQAIRTWRVD